MAVVDAVGAFEAKTHFAQLLVEVGKGRTISITRRGKPVAVLGPVHSTMHGKGDEIAALIQRVRAGVRLTRDEIIEFKNEGRKY